MKNDYYSQIMERQLHIDAEAAYNMDHEGYCKCFLCNDCDEEDEFTTHGGKNVCKKCTDLLPYEGESVLELVRKEIHRIEVKKAVNKWLDPIFEICNEFKNKQDGNK